MAGSFRVALRFLGLVERVGVDPWSEHGGGVEKSGVGSSGRIL